MRCCCWGRAVPRDVWWGRCDADMHACWQRQAPEGEGQQQVADGHKTPVPHKQLPAVPATPSCLRSPCHLLAVLATSRSTTCHPPSLPPPSPLSPCPPHLKYSEATSSALYCLPPAVKPRMPPPTVSGTNTRSLAAWEGGREPGGGGGAGGRGRRSACVPHAGEAWHTTATATGLAHAN
jgi:hypothetical protein